MQENQSFRIFVVVVALSVTLGLTGMAGRMMWFAWTPFQADSTDSKILEVRKGENPNNLTRWLVANGMIKEPKTFGWLGRLTRQWKNIKAGEYRISPAMTPMEIFSTLTSGISVAHPVTIKEGENLYEIADNLARNGLSSREEFIALCRDPHFISSLGLFKSEVPTSLEGYLFPDTYFLSRTQTHQEMARQMVKHFFDQWGPTFDEDARKVGMTPHQIVILASMIEKETGVAEERPLISSVFHNRLQRGMKLQSDPTTIYGIWETYKGNIRKQDLLTKNPFNTYFVSALPAGPISNPGKESIYAALHPAQSPYLYFVSHNDGTHEFSRSFEEHNRAVQKFQIDPRARKGKSWRNQPKVNATGS